jgi:peptide/nickel transport system substrate-binding protein
MASGSRWSGTKALPHNRTKANMLVKKAKADGFDGKVSLLVNSAPDRKTGALTLQAQLEAVGFDVSIDTEPSLVAEITQIRDGNYDLGYYGIEIPDANPAFPLNNQLYSNGQANRENYSNATMDKLLRELQSSTSDTRTQKLLDKIQDVANRTMPLLPIAAIGVFEAWTKNLHGVSVTSQGTTLYGKAWLTK